MTQWTEEQLPDWYDPNLHEVAKNGAIIDRSTRRITGNIKEGPLSKIQSTTAVEYHAIRRQKILAAQNAAGLGLARAGRSADWLEAWSKVVESKARQAIDNDDLASVKAAEFTGRAAGVLGDLRSVEGREPAPAEGASVTIRLDAAAVEGLRSFILAARERLGSGGGSGPGDGAA